MKSHAKVVVIGGGVVGTAVLFHLARAGWTDIVLLERDELTSGSTWHAAGGMHTINGDPNVAKLQKYTIELYKEIEELSGQATGVHVTGGVLLAATEARMDWLRGVVAKGRYLGLDLEEISAKEAAELMPLLDPKQFVGAVRNSEDGHLDPSGVTHAYAKAARKLGADVERFTKVEDIVRRPDGLWGVITNKGEVIAEHVVNAGGLWAREVGRMVGLELPVLAMEHMYLITEDMPEVKAWNDKTGTEIIHAVDFDGELYLRQERGGMLMGTYEKAGKPWSEHQTPWNFGHELLEPDIDRIAPSLEVGFRHFPAFQNTGIKQIINGPFTFAPDGNPLVGPVRGLPGFWVACGVMAGFSQGGGVGLALSNWMIDGDPGADIWAMDVSRYGDWASMAYTNAKVRENYSRRFSIRFPNEELPAGRPLKTTPVYDLLAERGAQFGVSYGLEVPLWYAPEGVKDEFSWRRSTDFVHVANEVKTVRERVGLSEISNFAKYRVTGSGAEAWLDTVLACKLPRPGRMTLAPMLKEDGRLIGDFSLAKSERQFYGSFKFRRRRMVHRRLRHRRRVPHALVREAPAGRRVGEDRGAGGKTHGPVDRRAERAQTVGESHARRRLRRCLQVHGRQKTRHWHGAVPRWPCQLHRRSRLRDLDRTRIPAVGVPYADGSGRRIRYRPVRLTRPQRAPARKELRLLGTRIPAYLRAAGVRARPFRRLQQGRRFHRQGRRCG